MTIDSEAPRHRPQIRDRVIVAVARSLTGAFFSTVEVVGEVPAGGPTILAASHLYGFVDPVVLVARLGHVPRFLAKATIWTNPAVSAALNFARVIPVHRAVDGSTEANAAMFADAVTALDDAGTLAVFAEGTTHDDPTIRPLRTGVARIALQAAGAGVRAVQVVPVGITYEDKVAVRGRALIHFGEPIAVLVQPGLVDADGVPDHDRVRAFTDELQVAVESLTPHFDSAEEALAFRTAARMTRRDGDDTGADWPNGGRPGRGDVALATIEADARRLARTDGDARRSLLVSVARYEMLRSYVGLDDAAVAHGVALGVLTRRVALLAIMVVVLSPLAIAGLFANLIPLVLVTVAGLVPRAPVSKGTVRVLVAAVTFPAMWILLAVVDTTSGGVGDLARSVTAPVDVLVGSSPADRSGALAAAAVLIAVPLLGILAVFVNARLRALVGAVGQWRTFLDRRGQLDIVRERRAEVVTTTRDLLGRAP
ncbi:MAG: 1-acyl-sn-glycerol-3-phosphate acyltransferase [Actinobacteria bacterium]|nr:1-acyl-sn-glycerol-3-phosphate acyltransferase [Actinomycetota bacterium]